jgi:uncharacterized membrane protein YraQ (UPF0718 family)
LDRAVLSTLAVFAVLAVHRVPDQAQESLRFTLQSLWGIAGFLLVSISFAAYARASAADQLTAKVFAAGGTVVVVVAASAFGVLSPFCSCGVVPIVAALLAGGVTSIPAAMAVFALVEGRVFGWYILLALAGSVLAGLGYAIVAALI